MSVNYTSHYKRPSMSCEQVLVQKKTLFLQAENKSHPTINDSAFVTRVHTALAQTMYILLHVCALYLVLTTYVQVK